MKIRLRQKWVMLWCCSWSSAGLLYLLVFAPKTAGTWANIIWIAISLVGGLMNSVAVWANDGMMPVPNYWTPSVTHCPLTPATRFRYLCDIVSVRIRYRGGIIFSGWLSFGDFFIYFGLAAWFAVLILEIFKVVR